MKALKPVVTVEGVGDYYDPVAAAIALQPLLEEHAQAADVERRIDRVVFEAVRDARLTQIAMPRRVGGLGLPIITLIETSAALAWSCPNTAWIQLVLSTGATSASLSPKSLRDVVLANGNETFCGAIGRGGSARPAPGGYRVTGKWPYASGSQHADWFMAAIAILDDTGEMVEEGVAFMPLRTDDPLKIEETWNVVGMRGTGSNTGVAEDRFVPVDLVLPFSGLRGVVAPEEMEAVDRWPSFAYLGLGLTGPVLGAAARLLALVTEKLKSRPVVYWKYPNQASSEVVLEGVGRSAIEIDSAWHHVRRAAAVLDVEAQQAPLKNEQRVQILVNCGYAMELARNASDRLIEIAGSSAYAETSPIQRFWRDIKCGSSHGTLNSRAGIECYGRLLAGMETNSTLF